MSGRVNAVVDFKSKNCEINPNYGKITNDEGSCGSFFPHVLYPEEILCLIHHFFLYWLEAPCQLLFVKIMFKIPRLSGYYPLLRIMPLKNCVRKTPVRFLKLSLNLNLAEILKSLAKSWRTLQKLEKETVLIRYSLSKYLNEGLLHQLFVICFLIGWEEIS